MGEDARLAVAKRRCLSEYDLEVADWVQHPFAVQTRGPVTQAVLEHTLAKVATLNLAFISIMDY